MQRLGVLYTLSAYVLWGLFPFYFHALNDIGALEILAHRIVWSLVFVALILIVLKRGAWIRDVLRRPKTLLIFTATSALIACNWGTYVYAIVSGRTLEASLGYFVNPLMSVALGAFFLRERLRRAQLAAVALAACGVLWITWQTGTAPLLGLAMAGSFAVYGLLRKIAPLGSLEGMALESSMLFPAAALYLGWLCGSGTLVFAEASPSLRGLLMLAGPITTIPLLLFASGVRMISYSTVGIIQYVSPTIVFFIGLFIFGEPFSLDLFIGFVLIWTAVAVFAGESLLFARRIRREVNRRAAEEN
ncbi:MAG: EamA family transporter RarD [Sutterella sp.]|nr:EamA family transporter RarD [Sutterella sp.]